MLLVHNYNQSSTCQKLLLLHVLKRDFFFFESYLQPCYYKSIFHWRSEIKKTQSVSTIKEVDFCIHLQLMRLHQFSDLYHRLLIECIHINPAIVKIIIKENIHILTLKRLLYAFLLFHFSFFVINDVCIALALTQHILRTIFMHAPCRHFKTLHNMLKTHQINNENTRLVPLVRKFYNSHTAYPL